MNFEKEKEEKER